MEIQMTQGLVRGGNRLAIHISVLVTATTIMPLWISTLLPLTKMPALNNSHLSFFSRIIKLLKENTTLLSQATFSPVGKCE